MPISSPHQYIQKGPPIVEARNIRVHFTLEKGLFSSVILGRQATVAKAVEDVSFAISSGEIVALIGESGSGKTTLGMSLLHLRALTSGMILFSGEDVTKLTARERKQFRKSAQIVFQDPFASLNPRLTIEQIVVEPLIIHRVGDQRSRRGTVEQALESVNLKPANYFLSRYPHELSGGQRQRVAIARAIVLNPRFLVADEPVSMLDVSVRAGVLDIFRRMAVESNLAILYISHDVSTVRQIANRVAVMYLGRIVEFGPAEKIMHSPAHPYAKALMAAIPSPDPDHSRPRVQLPGEIPSPSNAPSGCSFRTRCIYAVAECAERIPLLEPLGAGHAVACHLVQAGTLPR